MGYGSYTAADWKKLRASRKLDTASTNQIFTRTSIDQRFDPKYIEKREARDSEDHPKSTPIMIGVDVTGSMGYLSTQIVRTSLNQLMTQLYTSNLIPDPQLLFAAIGDVQDHAPLQVTQFESDIRIAEQLMDLWLEGRGGDGPEDFPLLWYFAAKHTDVDSWKLRKEKGFCFTIGDADCHDVIEAEDIQEIFEDTAAMPLSSKKLAEMAGETYELFHILIGSKCPEMERAIPGRIAYISREEVEYLPEIIISIMQLVKGMDKDEILKQWGELAVPVVKNALSTLKLRKHSGFFF